MNYSIFSELTDSFFVNLWAVILLAIIFYFVFKAAVKSAIKEVVKEEVISVLNNNNKETQLYDK